jgi:nitroreductase
MTVHKSFDQAVSDRRSTRGYLDTPVSETLIRESIDLALWSPNSSNLQPTEFYWVRDPEKKKQLAKACLGQPAATQAQELIVCVARTETWDRNRKDFLKFLLGEKSKGKKIPTAAILYYEKLSVLMYSLGLKSLMKFFYTLYQRTRGQVTMRLPLVRSDLVLWAVKSAALACQTLVLALQVRGVDSCMMEGFDPWKVRKLLQLPRDSEIVMVISAGYSDPNARQVPKYRGPKNWFLFEV